MSQASMVVSGFEPIRSGSFSMYFDFGEVKKDVVTTQVASLVGDDLGYCYVTWTTSDPDTLKATWYKDKQATREVYPEENDLSNELSQLLVFSPTREGINTVKFTTSSRSVVRIQFWRKRGFQHGN